MNEETILVRITYLLDACLNNRATDEERNELMSYMVQNQYQELFDELTYQSFYKKIEVVDIEPEVQDTIFQSILSTSNPEKKIISFSYWKWASIAAILIAIVASVSIFFYQKSEKVSSTGQEIVKNAERDSTKSLPNELSAPPQPLPSLDQALFMTSKGIALRLDELGVGEKKIIDGIVIEKNDISDISFLYADNFRNRSLPNRLNTIITPRGSKYKITLPDGSIVDLNSNSKLEFPTYFTKGERKVQLSGEAYFDVTSNKAKKFVVQSITNHGVQEVIVYGTEFNINAYADNKAIITTLVEGSVAVKANNIQKILKPAEQSTFFKDSLIVEPANMDVNISWRNNLFYFVDEPFENVMNQISRWYDVDFVYTSSVPTIKLWAQISRDKKLNEILAVLEKTNNIKFQINGKEVYVMQ